MARTNLATRRIKPEHSELLTLRVLRRERISPHFARITLGRGDVEEFRYMGFDQWFRLFIPVSEDSLSRLPDKLNAVSYAKFLTTAKISRPVLRNYSVRAYRPVGPDGPEIDVDFVLHGSAKNGTAGPAATWAQTCEEGDAVAILDEGIRFNPPRGVEHVLLVVDETGLPAAAGVLAALAPETRGLALIEVPSEADLQPLDAPAGVEVRWVVRDHPESTPGRAALAAAQALPTATSPTYGWVVGESNLAASLRRHWIRNGLPKDHIMFCGYWRKS
ncbi:siderophore-interacting protein [Saccharopolyspora spinosa]|uniref:NADPH-dependent ferric siderophore reductase n=1 Tax=Saccharopolyspora spinosa TaxID=60894 RepID=A0A2N3XW73_SACSN|nr:siderophore-interacting protein [Saccharopolyspora spinosa]PKW14851.1 NADPH-dependent ferric siderophore reductase [Saccharopolyspora spinosa]